MRRHLSLILALILILTLTGCSLHSGGARKTVTFYYPWADLEAKMEKDLNCTAIGSEQRETANRAEDLNYLLSQYLHGPLDPELKTPFPAGCRLVDAAVSDNTLCVTLDSTFAALENTQLTMACACLAKTCFTMADVAQVQIMAEAPDGSKAVDITIGVDSLLLTDVGSPSATEESQ